MTLLWSATPRLRSSGPCTSRTWSRTPVRPGTGTDLHYDSAWLGERGIPAPVVDGQMFGALLAQQLQDWAGPSARLVGLRFRFKNLVYAGETIRCSATVSAVEASAGHSLVRPMSHRRARRERTRRRCPRLGGGAAGVSVAIVGAAESDLGVTGLSILGLQTQAVTRALADAGLTLADVDGIATTGVSRFSATQLADYLGLTPIWTDSTFAGGSAFEMYVARAAQAIEAGQCSTVVISFASNQRSARSRSLGGVVETHTPEAQFEAPYGALYPASYYAMAAGAYLHRFDATREDLAEVAVAAREWALLNPAAFRHESGPLTVDDVLAGAGDLDAAHRGRLLPGHRRRGSDRADLARAGPRPREASGRGARLRRGDHQHLDDRCRRPVRLRGCRASGAAAFERAGLTVERRRRRPALRLVHHHGAAVARGARLLRPG